MATAVRRFYLNPPKYRAKRDAGSQSSGLGAFLRDYSKELAPFVLAWFYLLGSILVAREDFAPLAFVGLSALCSAALFFFGHKSRTVRQFTAKPKEGSRSWRMRLRLAYVLAAPFGLAAWALWATWPNAASDYARHRPSLWSIVVLVLITWIGSFPWLWELRSKRKITLELEGLSPDEIHTARRDAKTLINGWVGWTGRAGLAGAKLKGLTFSPWARVIDIEMRHGAQTLNWTALRMNKIETASLWTIAPGMARVDRSETDTRRLSIRYMLADPHADTLSPPDFDQMDDEVITLGLFENAATVIFSWVNTLIAGLTGAGKSGMINTLVRAFAKIPHVAMVGVDLKPGAPELGPWRDVMAALADSPEKTHALLDQILIGLQRRGDIMLQRGWKSWRATIKEPFLVVIIDEIQNLDRKAQDKVAKIAAMIRAYGGIIIVATQYPVKENLPSKIKQNLPQRIGFRTADATADRVIFGDSATRTGWKPSELCPEERKGSFLIRNEYHVRPVLARGWYSDEHEVTRDASTLASHRTEIDRATWTGEITDDIHDAEIVEAERTPIESATRSTREQVFDAIKIGHGTPKAISRYTEIPYSTVKLIMKQLAEAGEIENDGPRTKWRPAAFDPDDGEPDPE